MLTKPVKDISADYVIIEREEKKSESTMVSRASTGETGAPFDLDEDTICLEEEGNTAKEPEEEFKS